MTNLRTIKQKLQTVSRLREVGNYDEAVRELEVMIEQWPGNAYLRILLANNIQLQNGLKYSLEDAKQSLLLAIELDKSSPAGVIELGHFLDNVEDDPTAATKAFAEGVMAARRLLIDGLIGQAKALVQLEKPAEARKCLYEVLQVVQSESATRRKELNDVLEQAEDILGELLASRSVL